MEFGCYRGVMRFHPALKMTSVLLLQEVEQRRCYGISRIPSRGTLEPPSGYLNIIVIPSIWTSLKIDIYFLNLPEPLLANL